MISDEKSKATTPTDSSPEAKQSSDNTTRNTKYKKLSSQSHYCSYNCGWCSLLGRSIIEQKYKDFGNILLEDNLSYNFFGRELVK